MFTTTTRRASDWELFFMFGSFPKERHLKMRIPVKHPVAHNQPINVLVNDECNHADFSEEEACRLDGYGENVTEVYAIIRVCNRCGAEYNEYNERWEGGEI